MILSFLSNFTFLVPACFCFFHPELRDFGAAIMLAMAASLVYHTNELSSVHLAVDSVGVFVLLVYLTGVLCNSVYFVTAANLAAAGFGLVACFFYFAAPCIASTACLETSRRQYDWQHAVWHVFLSLSLLCIAVSYLHSTLRPMEDSILGRRIRMHHPSLVLHYVQQGVLVSKGAVAGAHLKLVAAIAEKLGRKPA